MNFKIWPIQSNVIPSFSWMINKYADLIIFYRVWTLPEVGVDWLDLSYFRFCFCLGIFTQ